MSIIQLKVHRKLFESLTKIMPISNIRNAIAPILRPTYPREHIELIILDFYKILYARI